MTARIGPSITDHFAIRRALMAEHLRQLLHLLVEEAQRFVVGHLWQRLGLEQLQERGEVNLGGIFPNAVEIDPHGIITGFAATHSDLSKNREIQTITVPTPTFPGRDRVPRSMRPHQNPAAQVLKTGTFCVNVRDRPRRRWVYC